MINIIHVSVLSPALFDGTIFVRMATLAEVTMTGCAVNEDGETTHAPAVEGLAAGFQVSRPQ